MALKIKDFLEKEGLSNLLSVALYGNGWASCDVDDANRELVAGQKFDCWEDKLAGILLAGGSIIIDDVYAEDDGEDDFRHIITLSDIENGLELMRDEYPNHWADLAEENDDAITGDVFLQLTVFGELIYG